MELDLPDCMTSKFHIIICFWFEKFPYLASTQTTILILNIGTQTCLSKLRRPNQTPLDAVSGQGLHCLPLTQKFLNNVNRF